VLLASAAGRGRAQTTGTIEGGAFLLLPVGARATALGQAAAAEGGTTEALFWNPAGLADIRHTELALHHYAAFFGNGDAFVLAVPANGLGVFTVGAYVVDYGEQEVPGSLGGPIVGLITARNVALEASYATGIFGGLTAGIAYKLVQFRVDCSGDCGGVPTAVGTTHAIDIGVRYALPTAIPIVLGATIRNLGFKFQVNNQAQADPLPTRLQVGVAFVALRPAAGMDGLDVRVLADLQGVVGQGDLAPTGLLGVESGYHETLRVRFGYAFLDTQSRGPSLGLGMKVGRVGIDLAKTFYSADAIGEQDPFHVSMRFTF
jgi:hypothetical protein